MKRIACAVIVGVLISLALGLPALGQTADPPPAERDPAFEQEIHDRLAQISPEAVLLFQEATAAMDAGDLPAAQQAYGQVLELAPGFPDALRRLSYVEVGLENVETGLQLAQQAHDTDPNSYNQAALAQALLATQDPTYHSQALRLARSAARDLPDDQSALLTLLMAGVANEDEDAIREASENLVRVAPDTPLPHYFAGLLAAMDNHFETAERELLLAQELGMPAEAVQHALDAGISSQARLLRLGRQSLLAIGGWIAGLILLTAAGMVLSKITLSAVQRGLAGGATQASGAERGVRGIYRTVITLTSAYFYISIPFLILVVVVITVGIFYGFFLLGAIPVRLAAIVGGIAIYTLYAIVRSVFTRIKEEEPGRPLAREEAPRLWSLAEEVAGQVDTRPIDAVYITPGVEVAVMERGRLLSRLRGTSQRCLILGLGALPGMTQGQFKAILAHEYGHFSNRDTAGGRLAYQVHASMYQMAYGLATKGQARWYNPAWLFVNGFNRIFLRITLGASRLQEILADRYAALAYGAQNIVDGLNHIVRQSLAFDLKVGGEVEAASKAGRPLANLYALPPLDPSKERNQLDARLQEVMRRPTEPYDSHPAMQDRLHYLQQLDLQATGRASVPGDSKPVWALLAACDQLQAEMTALVQRNVDQHTQGAART